MTHTPGQLARWVEMVNDVVIDTWNAGDSERAAEWAALAEYLSRQGER